MNTFICDDREEFIESISDRIFKNPSGFYYFLGKTGVGKKYVLNNIEETIKKKFKIYSITSDVIFEKNQKASTHNLDVSFTLNAFIGLSLSKSKNDLTKINYIITNLKSLSFKKSILISAVDYDILSPESRDFIFVLISNKKIIEKKVKKKITIILTSINDHFYGKFQVNKVKFKDYSKKNLYDYLINIHSYSPEALIDSKIDQIHKLCGTNFNLVNSYCDLIINGEISKYSLEAIVDLKMNYYISSGYKYNLTKEELESILYISSNSINSLTPQMISYINNENIDTILRGFQCAISEYFFEKSSANNKYEHQNHLFISEGEKNYLYKKALFDHSNILIQYYIYISISSEDEYFERAQFLYQYFGEINKEIIALVILALSKSYMLNDTVTREKIIHFFYNKNTDTALEKLVLKIDKAYENHYNASYKTSSNFLNDINFSNFNIVAAAELRRLQFKNGQLGRFFMERKMDELKSQLIIYIKKELILLKDAIFDPKEEKLLSLRIIFDIAPYVLDSRNDKETFNKLYDKSLILEKYINKHFIKKSYAEYVLNIFNRKAFLFAAPSVAMVYYEEAEAYFRDNNILEELIITLGSKAGMNIALHDYSSAINNCNDAFKIINDNQIKIFQIEKIYNNLFISEFLNFEREHTIDKSINEYAKVIIHKLNNLITKESSGKNHVILTNIASLSLYINNESQYLEIKKQIENSLKCKDVSDISDSTINDFYRYHFAWYEFYRYLNKQEWKKCTKIVNNLTGFYPSIFHNIKKMELRVEAAGYLLSCQKIPSTRDFCLNFLKYAKSSQNYSSRGLLLSDLQFTSWE